MTDPLGHSATFAYDAANQLTSSTDRDSQRITYSYDANGYVRPARRSGSMPRAHRPISLRLPTITKKTC